ncbi:hypothetical protein I203_107504 [Kwoniella mangroviensis CBS 8507]|uniref:hypothetical protein n=1 Tax=Kwoniella mangroviensis CBS 8507 TaxID=1296122 RepID=UPI00080CE3E7|nr:uncharacterized protein I203_02257 [Kwoniella mangroviensis CBS 8507]OCF68865.1 hypothetical protein I203_02257 [Kwoniella mangroviensis CBS 8507]
MSGDPAMGKPVIEEDGKPSTSTPASAQEPITTSSLKPSAGPSSGSKSTEPPHPLQPTPSHSHSGIIDLASPQSSPSKRQSTTPSLTSSRPAPASPASSRPPSTQFDSSLRDRSGSLSASSNRRVSSSSASSSTAKGPKPKSRSRASSKVRPKSMLGTNITLPESSTSTPSSEDQKDSSTLPIPEHSEQDISASTSASASQMMQSSWGDTPTESFQVILPSVIIRDFAYPSTDERYHGKGTIEDEGNASESNSNVFKWPWKGDPAESSSSGAGGGGGWGGFGFLGGWRNRSAQDKNDRPTFEDDDEDDDISDDEGDDQYYSSPAQSDSGLSPSASTSSYSYNILEPLSPSIEPKGYYRAAYPFQALSSSEMNLQEGDLVNLVGRGNGDPGWVIARRVNIQNGKIIGIDEKVGLVPESYLERVEVVED